VRPLIASARTAAKALSGGDVKAADHTGLADETGDSGASGIDGGGGGICDSEAAGASGGGA